MSNALSRNTSRAASGRRSMIRSNSASVAIPATAGTRRCNVLGIDQPPYDLGKLAEIAEDPIQSSTRSARPL
jgi:hypothetical protein